MSCFGVSELDLVLGVIRLGMIEKKVVFRSSGFGFYIPRETNNGGFHSMFSYVSRVLNGGGVFQSAKGGEIRDVDMVKSYILDAVEDFLKVYGVARMGSAGTKDWLAFVKEMKGSMDVV